MMWNNLDSVYFVGIGGIGMSALARFFHTRGKFVAGYDRTSTSLTDQLIREGIDIHFIDQSDLIPEEFRDPETTLVIYTPAIPENNKELNYFRNRSFRIIKRSQALGEVFNTGEGVAVAGTHGKTSVSTMLAHIFDVSQVGCNAFLGGISKNFNSNLLVHPSSDVIIAEADEYDRSFLALFPKTAVITSIDEDHLDIYLNKESIVRSFEDFVSQIEETGKLIYKYGLELEIPETLQSFTYSLSDHKADYSIVKEELDEGLYRFTVKTPRNLFSAKLGIPGRINVENALAAIAVSDQLGISLEQIASALESFNGVKRRFDIQVWRKDMIYIDDYAHHPEELRAFISSVKEIFPGRKVTGIFQPHLYSRTRDFTDGFAESLSLLDELVLLDIYPAREEPIPGVSSKIILDKVSINEKVLIEAELLWRVLEEREPEILLTMGAGDIDRLVEPIKNWMENR